MNYLYKSVVAILLTPVIYFVERRIAQYVGAEVAIQMKQTAMGEPMIDQ